MELFRALLMVAGIIIVSLLLLKTVDLITAWYVNTGYPSLSNATSEAAKATGVTDYKAEDYDVYGKSKVYLQPLDIALSVAVLAALAGIFIYTRERT